MFETGHQSLREKEFFSPVNSIRLAFVKKCKNELKLLYCNSSNNFDKINKKGVAIKMFLMF